MYNANLGGSYMNRNNSHAFKFGHRVPYSETDVVQNVIVIDPRIELEMFKRNSEKYRLSGKKRYN